jgi:hypothetical protein
MGVGFASISPLLIDHTTQLLGNTWATAAVIIVILTADVTPVETATETIVTVVLMTETVNGNHMDAVTVIPMAGTVTLTGVIVKAGATDAAPRLADVIRLTMDAVVAVIPGAPLAVVAARPVVNMRMADPPAGDLRRTPVPCV